MAIKRVKLEEVGIIAALNGHDVENPEVQSRILEALVYGDLSKVPKYTLQAAAKKVAAILVKQSLRSGVSKIAAKQVVSKMASLATALYDILTDNSAMVAKHAQITFGGKNRQLIQHKLD